MKKKAIISSTASSLQCDVDINLNMYGSIYPTSLRENKWRAYMLENYYHSSKLFLISFVDKLSSLIKFSVSKLINHQFFHEHAAEMIRRNSARENISTDFQNSRHTHGIVIKASCPCASEINEFSERIVQGH